MKSPEPEIEETEVAREGAPFVKPIRLGVLVALFVAAFVGGGWSLILVLLAVLAIVFVHELGHFVTARRAGMKVTEFFFGFGPRIVSFKRGEVEYGIKAIPAGAYVRIIGMSSVDEIPPEDEPRTYRQQPYRWRVLVASAGVLTHVVMAFVLVWAVLVFSGRVDESGWTIREVVPGSAAASVGAQRGDRLVSLAGVTTDTFETMTRVAEANREQVVDVVLDRRGQRITGRTTLLGKATVWGTIGEDLNVGSTGREVLVVSSRERGALFDAGLRSGDRIEMLNGVAVTDLASFGRGVAASSDGQLDLSVRRQGEESARSIGIDLGREVELSEPKGFFGVGQQPDVHRLGVLEAAPASVAQLGHMSATMFTGMGRVFSGAGLSKMFDRATTAPGDAGPRRAEPAATTLDGHSDRLSSIVGAVGIGSGLFQDGWVSAFGFLAFLNLTLGLVNLVPLLPFDGGHIMVATYEKIREKLRGTSERYFVDANKLVPLAVAVVGLFALFGLVAMYLDVTQPVRV